MGPFYPLERGGGSGGGVICAGCVD